MRLSETIKALQQAEQDARDYGREAEQEYERRKSGTMSLTRKSKGTRCSALAAAAFRVSTTTIHLSREVL